MGPVNVVRTVPRLLKMNSMSRDRLCISSDELE